MYFIVNSGARIGTDFYFPVMQVSLRSRLNGFGYELFQVSEERDEEVAAFCHMLDV